MAENPSALTITERRQLVFSKNVVLDALLSGDQANQGWLCRAAIQGISIRRADDGPRVVVVAERNGQSRWVEEEFGAAQIAATLIRYCRAQGIPLPRAAKKSIDIQGEAICLNISGLVTVPSLHSRLI